MVTWVPQHTAAHLLQLIHRTLEGACEADEYCSFVHALQDVLGITGGGMYRMKGLFSPLAPTAELGQGPNTLMRVRTQMRSRLTAWRKVLACRPGASMLALVGPHPTPVRGLMWVIAGDAAKEGAGSNDKVGLGCFFYGYWWHVPL
jgi:hypothetical protein